MANKVTCNNCGFDIVSGAKFCPSCGEHLSELPNGTIIGGRYAIQKPIGSGGMGRVYLAEHIALGRPVAVKLLHSNLLHNRGVVKRFYTEALASSRLQHQNVISIIDFGQESDGQLYIVMEKVEGENLEKVLRKDGIFQEQRLLRIVAQVCGALEEAHHHQVLHRDLKPENIMIWDRRDEKDLVKVLDFGLAKLLDPMTASNVSRITAIGSTCGTPEYMSPEQAQGESLDARTDIYSLGVIMYRMVSGRPPFVDKNPIAVAAAHVTQQPPPLHSVCPNLNISKRLEEIIYCCMEKNREKRFESATALKNALVELMQGSVSDLWEISSPGLKVPLPDGRIPNDRSPENGMAVAETEHQLDSQEMLLTRPFKAPAGMGKPNQWAGADSPMPEEREEAQAPEKVSSQDQLEQPHDLARQLTPSLAQSSPSDKAKKVQSGSSNKDENTDVIQKVHKGKKRRFLMPLMSLFLFLALGAMVGYYFFYPIGTVTDLGDSLESKAVGREWNPLAGSDSVLREHDFTTDSHGAVFNLSKNIAIELQPDSRLKVKGSSRVALHAGSIGGEVTKQEANPRNLHVLAMGLEATVIVGHGKFGVSLEGERALRVDNHDGDVTIALESAQILVKEGTSVRYVPGEHPSYRNLQPN